LRVYFLVELVEVEYKGFFGTQKYEQEIYGYTVQVQKLAIEIGGETQK
jgi:hypothetical protein